MEELLKEVLVKLESNSINRVSSIQFKYSKLINNTLWNRKLTLSNTKSLDPELFAYCTENFNRSLLIRFLIRFSSISKAIELIKKYKTDKSVIELVEKYPYNNIELFEFFSSLVTNKKEFYNEALPKYTYEGYLEIVELLLDRGADIHTYNDRSLRIAASGRHLEVLELLLDKGADIHAEDDAALKYATLYGYLEIVELLLNKGANIHARNDAALRNAVLRGHLEVLSLLLDRGANINVLDNIYLPQEVENYIRRYKES